jgi:hypothetical protein
MSTTNGNANALVILTEFERRLAACTTLGEAKAMRDEAEALRHYARVAAKGVQAQNRCAVARFLAERQLGELLATLPRATGPGRGKKNSVALKSFLGTIAAEGIPYHAAAEWQRMAVVPAGDFRTELERRCQPGMRRCDGDLCEECDRQNRPMHEDVPGELTADAVTRFVDWWIAVRMRAPDDDDKPLGDLAWDVWELGDDPRAKIRLGLLEMAEAALATARERLVAVQSNGGDVSELLHRVALLLYDLDRRCEAIAHGGLQRDRGLMLFAS